MDFYQFTDHVKAWVRPRTIMPCFGAKFQRKIITEVKAFEDWRFDQSRKSVDIDTSTNHTFLCL